MNQNQSALNRQIGRRIRNQREFLGYTREELSEKADISTQFLADIETGRKSMTAHTIINIAKSLLVSTDYLLIGDARQEQRPFDYTQRLSNEIVVTLEQLPSREVDSCIKILQAYLCAFQQLRAIDN